MYVNIVIFLEKMFKGKHIGNGSYSQIKSSLKQRVEIHLLRKTKIIFRSR